MFESFDIVPIWNYWKYSINKDFRYLLKDINYHSLIEIKESQIYQFKESFEKLTDSMQYANKSELELLLKCYSDFSRYLIDKTDKNKQYCHNSFGEYRRLLKSKYEYFMYKGKRIDDLDKFYNELRNKIGFTKLFHERINIFKDEIKGVNEKEWNLNDNILFIKKMLDVVIDEFKCSANKFFYYNYMAVEKVKKQQLSKQLKKTR